MVESEDEDRSGFLRAMLSVLAAAFGVQNSDRREKDFSLGRPMLFIVAGLVFTVLLVLVILLTVSIVLSS